MIIQTRQQRKIIILEKVQNIKKVDIIQDNKKYSCEVLEVVYLKDNTIIYINCINLYDNVKAIINEKIYNLELKKWGQK